MAYSVQIALTARRDARDYAAFIRDEQKSPDAARHWLDGLYVGLKGPAEIPNRFSVIPEAAELGFPYRSFLYQSHRVIYAVLEAEERVIVHRIYHAARRPLTEVDV